MLWLAWKLAGAGQLAQVDTARLNVTFWQGVGLQFVNIKAWMLALTLTAGWVVNAAGQPASQPGRTPGHHLRRDDGVCLQQQLHLRAGGLAAAPVAGAGRRLLWFNRALALVLVATASGW
jgi:threonine/homoserine/homoserine lactone efflux protein